jgi:hypothetical protein
VASEGREITSLHEDQAHQTSDNRLVLCSLNRWQMTTDLRLRFHLILLMQLRIEMYPISISNLATSY